MLQGIDSFQTDFVRRLNTAFLKRSGIQTRRFGRHKTRLPGLFQTEQLQIIT